MCAHKLQHAQHSLYSLNRLWQEPLVRVEGSDAAVQLEGVPLRVRRCGGRVPHSRVAREQRARRPRQQPADGRANLVQALCAVGVERAEESALGAPELEGALEERQQARRTRRRAALLELQPDRREQLTPDAGDGVIAGSVHLDDAHCVKRFRIDTTTKTPFEVAEELWGLLDAGKDMY